MKHKKETETMKIAYVTTYDSSDIHAWSGAGSYILQALKNSGFQTEPFGNLHKPISSIVIGKWLLHRMLHEKYIREFDPIILRHYAKQVKKNLEQSTYDVVFSPSTVPIAHLKTDKPILFWADATFAGMIDFYPNFSNLCAETIRDGNNMEQLALSKCSLAIYASEWAANTAIRNYDVDPAKVKVVPFGANVNCNRTLQDIDLMSRTKNFAICKLLFVGVEWVRKGGDFAFRVADLLNQRGIRTELHVVGCNPPRELPDFVKLHGFISKKTEEGRKFLDILMAESLFLILPTKAECYGLVFAEASSFGLPSLATRIGGIPTAIRDGINGHTFSLDAPPESYCDYIETFMSSKQLYRELALSSFREYSERLNWSSSGRKVYNLVQEFCA